MQRWLLTIGAVVILLGLAWPYVNKLGLGRLPGDFRIHTSNGVFYFPLTTSILLSLVLSLVLWLFRR
jgi:ribose/xylose/arabinose/galactoside ABC-type transport system permease subunit